MGRCAGSDQPVRGSDDLLSLQDKFDFQIIVPLHPTRRAQKQAKKEEQRREKEEAAANAESKKDNKTKSGKAKYVACGVGPCNAKLAARCA